MDGCGTEGDNRVNSENLLCTTVWIETDRCGQVCGYPQSGMIEAMSNERTPSSALRRILPTPATVTIEDAYRDDRSAHDDRPWIGMCMVMSVDGSIAYEGTSGGLGNDHDLEVLLTVRRLSDMVLVGAGTVRGEGYGAPEKPGQRIGVVTNSGSVDLDRELFTSGAGFLITSEAAEVDETRVDVLRAGRDEVDLTQAVQRLTEIDPHVRWVQAEGGAALNGALLDAGLLDELFVTISPNLVGGAGPRITGGAAEVMRAFELVQVLTDDDGYLFTQYRSGDMSGSGVRPG